MRFNYLSRQGQAKPAGYGASSVKAICGDAIRRETLNIFIVDARAVIGYNKFKHVILPTCEEQHFAALTVVTNGIVQH